MMGLEPTTFCMASGSCGVLKERGIHGECGLRRIMSGADVTNCGRLPTTERTFIDEPA